MQCLVHRKRRVQGMFSASCTLGGKGIEGLSKGSWCQAPVANADAKANKNGSLKQAQMEAHVECTQKALGGLTRKRIENKSHHEHHHEDHHHP